jgi:RNA polymerase sigma-70 factor (ECF subfamily)
MQTFPLSTPRAFLRSLPVAPAPDAGEVRTERPSGIFSTLALATQPANEAWPDRPAETPSEAPPASGVCVSPVVRDGGAEDAALVRAAWAGDRRAHVAIWRKYTVLVRSKIGRSIGGQDVEDHVQEVFLRLFEYLSQLRDPTALRSFIIGITLRVAGTELRRRRCRWWLSLTPTGELPDPQPWADDGSDMREILGGLLSVLGKLTPHSSRVFELRYIEEKELADVAKTMNISLATAKRHLARASARVFAMAEREPTLAGFLQPGRTRGAFAEELSAAE